MSHAVSVFSRSSGKEERKLRPIGPYLLVKPQAGQFTYGGLIAIVGDQNVDVLISEVLSASPKAKAQYTRGNETRNVGRGDRVLSVRVANKKVDSIDMRTESGDKVAFLEDLHVLAVVADDAIYPCNDLYLVKAQGDRRMIGGLEIFDKDSLLIESCEILAAGPNCDCAEVGEFTVAPTRFGVTVDSIEIRKRFSSNLKLIRQSSVTGIGSAPVEGRAYPELLKEKPLI